MTSTPIDSAVAIVGRAECWRGDSLRVLPALPWLARTVDAVVTDPPYSSGGQFRGDRTARTSTKYQSPDNRGLYPEFAGDTRDQRGFLAWATLWLAQARDVTKDGGLLACFADWRQLPTLTDAVQAAGWTWRGVVVWDKTEAARPMKGRYRAQAEFLAWATNGHCPSEGRCAPGVFRHSAISEPKEHIASKPVRLMQDVLQLVPEGGLVLDPFMGAGSTGVAAIRTGRRFVGIECEPYWHAHAVARLAAEQERTPPPAPAAASGRGTANGTAAGWQPSAGALELLAGAA